MIVDWVENGIVAACISVGATYGTIKTVLHYHEKRTEDLTKRVEDMEKECKDMVVAFRKVLYNEDNLPRFVPMITFTTFQEKLLSDIKDNIATIKTDIMAGFNEMRGDNKEAHKEIFDRLKKVESIRGL